MQKKRGRKGTIKPASAAGSMMTFAEARLLMEGERPAPPDYLGEREAEEWNRTTSVLPSGWFGPETEAVLARYCKLAVSSKLLAAQLQEVEIGSVVMSMQDRACLIHMLSESTKTMGYLATVLRMTPKNLLRNWKAAAATVKQTEPDAEPKPWEDQDAA